MGLTYAVHTLTEILSSRYEILTHHLHNVVCHVSCVELPVSFE